MNGKNLSPEALEMVANRFKILSEPLRLGLLQRLREGEKSVSELTELIKTSQPNVSKHLKILQSGGFIKRHQKGNTVFYAIADESIFTLCELVCDSLETRLKNQTAIFAST